MAKYRVLEKSFINNTIVEAGEIVEYEGRASGNLELIEEAPAKPKGKAKAAPVEDDGQDLV